MYWTIRAWGNYITSQNIAHGQAFSFTEIEQIMNLDYKTEDGTPMVVNLCLVDSGFNADATYDFCAKNTEWALPVKGSSNPMQSHYKFSTVNKTASVAYGMVLVIVDGGKYKDMIASRMRKENGTGSWMVYKGCDREYAEQVTSEHKVNARSGKRTQLMWVPKTSHADNHYLDCEVYAMAAADTLGIRMIHLQDSEEVAPVQQQKQEQHYAPEENWITQNEGKWV
jgi:phage terminase large subunit GpA-like protein